MEKTRDLSRTWVKASFLFFVLLSTMMVCCKKKKFNCKLAKGKKDGVPIISHFNHRQLETPRSYLISLWPTLKYLWIHKQLDLLFPYKFPWNVRGCVSEWDEQGVVYMISPTTFPADRQTCTLSPYLSLFSSVHAKLSFLVVATDCLSLRHTMSVYMYV